MLCLKNLMQLAFHKKKIVRITAPIIIKTDMLLFPRKSFISDKQSTVRFTLSGEISYDNIYLVLPQNRSDHLLLKENALMQIE